jgi:hypothetical protein
LEVLQKPYEFHPVLDDKNSYVGYYEIDDMFFHQTSFLKEQGRIIKVKREYWIIQ